MFKFFKDLREDIECIKNEVFDNCEYNTQDTLVSRVEVIEEKIDALLKYLKLATDYSGYTQEVEPELIIRKRTKKDDIKLPSNFGKFNWGNIDF